MKSMRKLLKRNEVIAIRRQHAAGHTIQEIATAYGRAWETIADCVHGRTYARIKDVRVPPLPEPPTRFTVPVARRIRSAVRPRAAPKPAAHVGEPPASAAERAGGGPAAGPSQPSGAANI